MRHKNKNFPDSLLKGRITGGRHRFLAANRRGILTLLTEEQDLVRRAQGGDPAAFNRLVDRYSRAVLARQVAGTRDMSSAEDLTQETFLRAWQGLARLEDVRAFGSWLLSTAGFVFQEWIRRKRRSERLREQPPDPEVGAPDPGPDLPLAEAIAELPPEIQQLLALRHDHGMSCEEIARELGKPLGTVTKNLSRAYARLRERLVRK